MVETLLRKIAIWALGRIAKKAIRRRRATSRKEGGST